ncbi:polyprenyl synthetase family protein [Nocardia carnea]|uniref:polyprenyl synthetase family protein n=1 Tax=Nocardia carnea TaxID=37328 RepID=UPI003D7893B4
MQNPPKCARLELVNAQRVAREPRIGRPGGAGPEQFAAWVARVDSSLRAHVGEFVAARCAEELGVAGFDEPRRVVLDFVSGGKYLRPTFMYLGYLCGAEESDAALRASASLELLHAFALLQDDVMDESGTRRGLPSAHVRLAGWHSARGASGSSARFGESAAVLVGDLCLVWAERMLRESGIDAAAAARVWPRYDAMRAELAVGQLADLLNDAMRAPALEDVLDIARRKSGNYTVRRPLELGAAMAGCPPQVLEALGEYGACVGEAFQLRDDLLGLFGDPATTGKPAGADLRERKATTIVALTELLAGPAGRARLHELWSRGDFGDEAVRAALTVIIDSGAPQHAEQMITDRLQRAQSILERSGLDPAAVAALQKMAWSCTRREH